MKRKYFNFDGVEEGAAPVDLLATGEWAVVILEEPLEESKRNRPKIRRRGRRVDGGAGTTVAVLRMRSKRIIISISRMNTMPDIMRNTTIERKMMI